MSESLAASPGLWIAFAALVAAALGFAIGRIGGAAARRARALQLALAEERAAHDKARGEYDAYRKSVADHFTETSERLHDLTLQYRSVYEHLAKGAAELCPRASRSWRAGSGWIVARGGAALAASWRTGSEPEPAQPPAAPVYHSVRTRLGARAGWEAHAAADGARDPEAASGNLGSGASPHHRPRPVRHSHCPPATGAARSGLVSVWRSSLHDDSDSDNATPPLGEQRS
jgi:uncharacterized membrane-anchored protein YhcB (DUF1043 family)